MSQEIAVGVEVDRVQRHFLDQLRQFFFVLSLASDAFLQLAATDENEGIRCDVGHASS